MLRSLDQNSDERIDFSEFLSGAVNHKNLLSEANLKCAFKTFDCDNDGYLNIEKFRRCQNEDK